LENYLKVFSFVSFHLYKQISPDGAGFLQLITTHYISKGILDYVHKVRYFGNNIKGYVLSPRCGKCGNGYITLRTALIFLIFKTLSNEEKRRFLLYSKFLVGIRTNPFIKQEENPDIEKSLIRILGNEAEYLRNNIFFRIYILLYHPELKWFIGEDRAGQSTFISNDNWNSTGQEYKLQQVTNTNTNHFPNTTITTNNNNNNTNNIFDDVLNDIFDF